MMTDITSTTKPRTRTAITTAAVGTGTKPATLAAPAAPKPTPATPTKSATVIKLLLRTKGATATELIAATDWQPHSLRAFLSGLRKKGRVIAREPRKNGETSYRIIAVTDGAGGSGVADDDGTDMAAGATAGEPTGDADLARHDTTEA